jgi:hypothetical protein
MFKKVLVVGSLIKLSLEDKTAILDHKLMNITFILHDFKPFYQSLVERNTTRVKTFNHLMPS